MCGPAVVPLIMVGLTVASSAMTYASADAAADAQDQSNAQNTANIEENYRATLAANSSQLDQDRARAVQDIELSATEARAARASQRTAAGEAGVSGNSIDAIMGNYYFNELGLKDDVTQNYENAKEQNRRSGEAGARAAASQINSLPQPQRPSLLGAGLQIAGSAVSAYSGYQASQAA